MRSKWKEYKVSDFVSFQNGYAFKSKDFSDNGKYKVIKIKELKDGKVKFFSDSAQIDIGDNADLEKYQVINGDILFALTGDPVSKPNPLSWVGRVSLYSHDEISLLNQRVCKAVFSDNISPLFFYYYFRQEDVFFELAGKATGSASQANISTKTISDTTIKIPDIIEQHKIAYILSTIDEKIALNTAINENLEQQAQALFKAWFVDFEPFGGVMPDDWRKSNLLEIADYLNGLAMQKYRPNDNEKGLPVLKIKELRQGVCDANSELCSPKIKSEYIIKDGDVIFSWSGSLLVDLWCGGTCGLNQHLFKVTSSDYDKWFYYLWTKYHLNRFISIAADMATTMGHIKRKELSESEVIVPNDIDYQALDKLLNPIIESIINIRIENRHLAELRDTLLPKLMNGEIDVSAVKI